MVGSPRAAIVADDDEFFHTASLLRLAGWGLAAAASVTAVIFIARTDLGTKRFANALAAIGAPPTDPQHIATAQLSGRIASAERDARRTIETVQAISADRERVQARLITIEHDVGELAGSIRRAMALAENKPAPEARLVTTEAKPSTAEARHNFPSLTTSSTATLMQPRNSVPGWTAAPAAAGPLEVHATPKPGAIESNPQPSPAVTGNAPPRSAPVPLTPPALAPPVVSAEAAQAAVKEETTASIPASEPAVKVEFGVDLGPATTMARLRSRWTKLAAERPDLVKGLRPLVTVRDTGAGKPVEVRLLVGPMTNVNGATDFCSALASPQYLCRPAVFDGQRLTVQ